MKKLFLLFVCSLVTISGFTQIISGTCGDNLTWNLTSDFDNSTTVLTISGSGMMWNYSLSNLPSWYWILNQNSIVEVENGVTSIGDWAFLNGPHSITIPNSVTSIGDYAFSSSRFSNFSIPNSVVSIGIYAFAGCKLTSVSIPNSVVSIGVGAFTGCSLLTSVSISANVTSIEDYTFEDCNNLTSVSIPNRVTSIGERAFLGTGLTSITIPNSVTSIGREAFTWCLSLTSVSIPNSVTSIRDFAFSGCPNLKEITVYWDNPLGINDAVFWQTNQSICVLKVPKGTANKYKAAPFWQDFLIQEEGGTDTTGIYNPGDIAVINAIIDNNGLKWTKANPADGSYAPSDWTGVIWSSDTIGKRITDLNIPNQSLTGELDLSKLTNLQNLDCSHNSLNTLNVSNCANLYTIWCNYNLLSSLNFSDCANLITLECDNNQLASLNVSGYTSLKWFNCGLNKLTLLNVTGCTNLYQLACYNNLLTSLDVSGCTNLSDLTCVANQFNSLNANGCKNLQTLNCQWNQLVSLNLSGCAKLEGLFCSGNQLSDENLPSLYRLGIKLDYYSDYQANRITEDYFDLRGNKGFTESAIRELADNLPYINYEQILYDKLPEKTITCSINDTILERGKSYNVTYEALGEYEKDNRFYVQLSNPNGSFDDQYDPNNGITDLTTMYKEKSGTIKINILENLPAGNKYRLRVCSTFPETFGSDNGKDLTIDKGKITCSIGETVLEQGKSYNVTYEALGEYDEKDNRFYVQLSNPNGSFDDQYDPNNGITDLTTMYKEKSGTIKINILENLPAGNKYRLRVCSTFPEIFGSDNGKDLTIGKGKITCSIGETVLERGKSYNVTYEALGEYDEKDNRFYVQLSDPNGSFDDQYDPNNGITDLTTMYKEKSGIIKINILEDLPGGNKYRLRVCSTFPETFGSDNGKDLTIGKGKIACSIDKTILKRGEPYYVKYEASGAFNPNNRFQVQLSNSLRSFENSVIISDPSQVVTDPSGLIKIIIPQDIPQGTKYRLRVIATDPQTIGSDNGLDLAIGINAFELTDYLTLYFDNYEEISETIFRFSGNVNINHSLYFDCQLAVEKTSDNTAVIQFDGGMYAFSLAGERINGERAIKYGAIESTLNLIFPPGAEPLLAVTQIAGMWVNIGNITFDNSGANDWIQYDFSPFNPPFPLNYIIDKLLEEDQEQGIYNYVPIPSKLKGAIYYSRSQGRKYMIDVALNNLKLPFGLAGINSLTFKYDPIQDEYEGGIEIALFNVKTPITQFKSIPVIATSETGDSLQTMSLDEYIALKSATAGGKGLTVGLDVTIKKGGFDCIAYVSNVEIPIPETPLAITKYAANFSLNNAAAYFGFGMTVDVAPILNEVTGGFTSAIIEGKDIGFKYGNPPFNLMFSGKLALFKQEVANAQMGWNGDKGLFEISGNANVMGIYHADLDINITKLCYGHSYGYIQAPQGITKYDFLSSLSGKKFNGIAANWYGWSFDFELQPWFLFGKKFSCAAVYTKANRYEWYWGKNLKDLGINVNSLKSATENIQFYLAEGNIPSVFLMLWGENAPVNFSAVSPSGKTYNNANTPYQSVDDKQLTVMAVDKPESGVWTVIPKTNYAGFKAYSMDLAPTIYFDKPASQTQNTDIRLSLNDFNDSLTVTFFYDNDKAGFDGVPIAEFSNFQGAILDYQWDTQGLPNGDYSVYCRVADGNNTPVFLYAPGAISVNNGTTFNVVPQNVRYEKQANDILINRDASSDNRIDYATTYCKSDKTGEVSGSVGGRDSTSVVLTNLEPGVRYQVWATYTDTLGNEGAISNIVEFTYIATGSSSAPAPRSANANNLPYFVYNNAYWVFSAGQRSVINLDVYDADGDKLSFSVLDNISNYDFSGNSFGWTPSEADVSLQELRMVVSDGRATDTLVQKIRFIEKANQELSVSFAAPVLYAANFGFVNIKNPFLTGSISENIAIQNKRTGYTAQLPCDKISDDLFRGKMVLTNDQYSFMPVQNGDTLMLDYRYGGKVYTDYAVYNAAETGLFQLTPSDIVEQKTKIDIVESEQKVMLYPNPNIGEFILQADGLQDAVSYRVTVYDLQGKTVYATQDICRENGLYRRINIRNVVSGNYLVKLVVVDVRGGIVYSGVQKMVIR